MSPSNLLRLHSILLSISLKKDIGEHHPQDKALTSAYKEPFTTTLWLYPSSQFLSHWIVHPPNHMGPYQKSCRNLDRWCLLVFFVTVVIILGHQTGQSWFALSEAMLPCSLPWITSLSFMCHITASRRICSMILPATEAFWSSFLLFLKMGVVFPFFQPQVALPWLFKSD